MSTRGSVTFVFACVLLGLAGAAMETSELCTGDVCGVQGNAQLQNQVRTQQVSIAEHEEHHVAVWDRTHVSRTHPRSASRKNFSALELGVKTLTMRAANDIEKEAFLDMHNLYRCMHDVPEVTWNDVMADAAENYVAGMTTMQHSPSANRDGDGGQAGENLAWSSAPMLAADAVAMWYDEVTDCDTGGPTAFTDGCAEPKSGKVTGHFTALVWQGVKEIGCAFSDSTEPTLIICRYKPDTFANMPNLNKHTGNYKNHVLVRTKTEGQCTSGTTTPTEGRCTWSEAIKASIKGHDLEKLKKKMTMDQCKAECDKNTGCHSIQFKAKKGKKKGKCVLGDCAIGEGGCTKKNDKKKFYSTCTVTATPDDDDSGANDDVSDDASDDAGDDGTQTSGECLIKDPDWRCDGFQCINPPENYVYYSAAGGPWCLTAASEYCTKDDASWCLGECSCPGNCAHACGRCPTMTGADDGSSSTDAPTPAPNPGASPTPAPAFPADKCLVSNAAYHTPTAMCKGKYCQSHTGYTRTYAAGGKWCLTAESSYCKAQDASWCNAECNCPGSCAHACGRCPPQE